MRARQPDESGYVVNGGVRVYYEVHGSDGPTVLLMPTWSIVDSRHWKMQVPYLSRHFRVLTFDPRGNGRSDRPGYDEAYADDAFADDALAVLDATGTDQAVLAGLCTGVGWSLLLAAAHPDRVLGLVAIASNAPLGPLPPERREHAFDAVLDTEDGWAKENRHYWLRDWPDYVRFHSEQIATEPYSSKVYDDLVMWGLNTDAETMLRVVGAPKRLTDPDEVRELCRSLTCPTLVVVGEDDQMQPAQRSCLLAEEMNGDLLVVEGGGHLPQVRHPVVVNHAIRDFVARVAPPRARRTPWLFARNRPRRALWVSSPIGLGHVLRDLAVARAVRARVSDLEIHWWAQEPVTAVLEAEGEIVHPASQEMASESAHWESESVAASGHHDLHAFYAFRAMDEILCANYMLFDDVVRETPYDVWVGDECWEIDHYLHENPERKIAPYVFMTDVIGFLPVDPQGDPREAELCADYNAEMIEHLARFPAVRDASLFVGDYAELPAATFGPGLPPIREWARQWFEPVPYVLPFDPAALQDPQALRERLGYGRGYPLLMASAGGTAVGRGMLELVAEGFRYLRKDLPDARMLMATGPRIDPAELPDVEGLDKVGYVHGLFEHLAAADAAVVQGGLSTTMELVAARRPFVYFPLRSHWEQQHFVTHRLNEYGAGAALDFASTEPIHVAEALRAALTGGVNYRSVPPGGADRAAERIVGLLRR